MRDDITTLMLDDADEPVLFNKVLVVEDSLSERFRMVALLEKLGYTVTQAEDGSRALEWLADNHADIILSDWSMPNVCGLDLCRTVREQEFNNPYFILVTGRDTTADLVEGIEAGADDFISKPFNREELRVRLIAGQRIMKMRGALEEQNRQLQFYIDQERYFSEQTREELSMASEMLGQMLPDNRTFSENIHVGVFFKPASGIGGDFYNFFRLDDTHIGFYVLDVAGHGIASALISFSLARAISPLPKGESILFDGDQIREPADVVSDINKRFLSQETGGKYFTMIYGVMHSESGSGTLCQAGHPHPVILTKDGGSELLGNGGFPIGIFEGADFDNVAFTLSKGSRLVLYTDGITEIQDTTGAQAGIDRLVRCLSGWQNVPLQGLIDHFASDLQSISGSQPQSDDMALVVIENF